MVLAGDAMEAKKYKEIPGYSVISQLFLGENCTIYRAVSDRDGIPTILKMLSAPYPSPLTLARFRQEFKLVKSLKLQGVPKVFELSHPGDYWMISFLDIKATSLTQLMQTNSLEPRMVTRIALAAAKVLAEIHQA